MLRGIASQIVDIVYEKDSVAAHSTAWEDIYTSVCMWLMAQQHLHHMMIGDDDVDDDDPHRQRNIRTADVEMYVCKWILVRSRTE